MPIDVTTSVLRNRDLGHGNFLLDFAAPEMAREMLPAQFFMIGIPGAETLLRRPFSVCGLPGTFDGASPDSVQVLYKVFGTGTRLLGSLKAGSPITILGPLGNGFRAPEDPSSTPVFVAGGIGSAPFPAFAARLGEAGFRPRMFYGARSRADLPLVDWFEQNTDGVVVATDDGSVGRRGFVTEPLAEFLEQTLQGSSRQKLHVYACGPEPMLKAVTKLTREHGVRCDLAMEAHMACGFGVCLGCVVPCRSADDPDDSDVRYDRVCVEGPVMNADVLAW